MVPFTHPKSNTQVAPVGPPGGMLQPRPLAICKTHGTQSGDP